MKTAISVPDSLFEEAERLARRLKKSRSQLYQEALSEYLALHDTDEITQAMDKVCNSVDSHPDSSLAEAARRVLERSEW